MSMAEGGGRADPPGFDRRRTISTPVPAGVTAGRRMEGFPLNQSGDRIIQPAQPMSEVQIRHPERIDRIWTGRCNEPAARLS